MELAPVMSRWFPVKHARAIVRSSFPGLVLTIWLDVVLAERRFVRAVDRFGISQDLPHPRPYLIQPEVSFALEIEQDYLAVDEIDEDIGLNDHSPA